MISARNRCPFTPNQWQELEHQALIFKYMVSGVPIPPELICSVKTSLDSSMAPHLFPNQPIGWGCFQVSFGRKVDPEPGRCRRTDGKKWRCSKEAYPDSKYCERHMHRGKSRSRKHVEVNSTTAAVIVSTPPPQQPPPPPPTATSILSPTFSFSQLSSEIYTHGHDHHHHSPDPTAHLNNPFLFSHQYSSNISGGSFQNDTSPHQFLDSGTGISCSLQADDKDYRYGTREGVDERSFFPDSYLSPYNQGFGNSGGSKQRRQQLQQQQQQHCFVLGTDIKSCATASARPIKSEKHNETQKPVHQFFGDWSTNKNDTDSWLDLASNSGVHSDS